MTKKLLVLVASVFALAAAALLIAAPARTAGADQAAIAPSAACPNPGYYTGTSSTGNFQDALDDAISKAETCAGCCDILVSWELVQTEGERGGFVGKNEVDVTIKASW